MLSKADNASTVNTKLSLHEVLSRFSATPDYDVSIAAALRRVLQVKFWCGPGADPRHRNFVTAGSKVPRRAEILASCKCLHKTGRPGLHQQFL